jgi:hypothetical protein
MKKILPLFVILLMIFARESKGADTLYVRFNNYYIKDATPYDTLIFDVEIKSFTSGTYLCGFQTDIYFNTTTFGLNALPVAVIPLDLVTAAFIVPVGPANPASNYFRVGNTCFPPYIPANLAQVPTASWGKLIRFKMLVLNNSQNLGISFNLTAMGINEKFVKTITSSASAYTPLVSTNTLAGIPSTPTNMNLLISELGDPSNSGADFIEIYNTGTGAVNFALGPACYLTMYDGSTYQNFQLTGNIDMGGAYVAGGNNYASAYPGKASDQTNGLVDQNGTDSWYLTIGSPYPSGVLVDLYNGSTLPYTGKHAVRRYMVTSPDQTFTLSEWGVTDATNMDMTPGSHRVTLEWDGSTGMNWRDTSNWTPSYVPDVGHDALIPDYVLPQPSIPTGTNMNVHDLLNGTGSK